MQQCNKRQALKGEQLRRLGTLLESRGESALALELRLTRQTLARAAAGLLLNSPTYGALVSYLGSP